MFLGSLDRHRSIMVDGWMLEVDDDHSTESVRKISYTAVHWDGRRVSIDVSPYEHLSDLDFTLQVQAGFPRRTTEKAA